MDKVYDRVVLATAEYELAPEVAEQLRGDKGEKGADGVGYTDINLEGEELIFHRTDGSDQRVPAPRGKDGEPGRDGVDGAPGKDGVSPPAPNISVGEVSEGEASATVTGSYPDLKINLTIPRGATGPKGDTGSAGPKGDTGNIGPRGERGETGAKGADAEPLNLAVTASTLAAGSEATAQLSGDYPNLTLALGLPAGAKGDAGKNAEIKDTGWRNISTFFTLRDGWEAKFPDKYFLIRRVGNRVIALLHDVILGSPVSNHPVSMPEGFRVDDFYNLKNHTLLTDSGNSFFGKATYWNGGLQLKVHTAEKSRITVQWDYSTRDTFPVILPGTPA